VRTINGAAVLEYGNHLPFFHEPPLGFVVQTTIQDKEGTCKSSQNSVVRMDSHRFRIETEFMLTTGFWLLTTRKTVRFCNWLRIPPVRNQAAVLVQASGKRQIIAVLQNGGAVMRKAIQDGCAVIHLRSQSIGCSRSILNCLPTEMGEEPRITGVNTPRPMAQFRNQQRISIHGINGFRISRVYIDNRFVVCSDWL
jgi:hypothetical protein